MKAIILGLALLGACGRSTPPTPTPPPSVTASGVCEQLVAVGVGAKCRPGGRPGALGAAAAEYVVFDLPALPGRTGQVLRFNTPADYAASVDAFASAAIIAGRHRYGSEHGLIFVQLSNEASTATGDKAKAVVAGL